MVSIGQTKSISLKFAFNYVHPPNDRKELNHEPAIAYDDGERSGALHGSAAASVWSSDKIFSGNRRLIQKSPLMVGSAFHPEQGLEMAVVIESASTALLALFIRSGPPIYRCKLPKLLRKVAEVSSSAGTGLENIRTNGAYLLWSPIDYLLQIHR